MSSLILSIKTINSETLTTIKILDLKEYHLIDGKVKDRESMRIRKRIKYSSVRLLMIKTKCLDVERDRLIKKFNLK